MKRGRHRMLNGHPGDIPTITETQGFMFGKPRAWTVRMKAPRNVTAIACRAATQATSPQSLGHRFMFGKLRARASPVPGRFAWRHYEKRLPPKTERAPGRHPHSH